MAHVNGPLVAIGPWGSTPSHAHARRPST